MNDTSSSKLPQQHRGATDIGEVLRILERAGADAIIRRPQVRTLTGLSDSTIERLVAASGDGGDFPSPVLLTGARAVGWRLSSILRWIASRPVANDQSGAPQPAANAVERGWV